MIDYIYVLTSCLRGGKRDRGGCWWSRWRFCASWTRSTGGNWNILMVRYQYFFFTNFRWTKFPQQLKILRWHVQETVAIFFIYVILSSRHHFPLVIFFISVILSFCHLSHFVILSFCHLVNWSACNFCLIFIFSDFSVYLLVRLCVLELASLFLGDFLFLKFNFIQTQ